MPETHDTRAETGASLGVRQFPDWDEAQIQRETARRMSHGVTEIVPR